MLNCMVRTHQTIQALDMNDRNRVSIMAQVTQLFHRLQQPMALTVENTTNIHPPQSESTPITTMDSSPPRHNRKSYNTRNKSRQIHTPDNCVNPNCYNCAANNIVNLSVQGTDHSTEQGTVLRPHSRQRRTYGIIETLMPLQTRRTENSLA